MRTDPGVVPLVTERLLLRRSIAADADAISAYRSDPEVHVHQGWGNTDADHVRAEIVEMSARAPGEPGGWVQFSVFTQGDATLIGDVGLSPAEGEPGVIKVGYTVAPAHQGNGYATEAVRALVDYAFDVLEAEIVRAYADEGNVRSTRVMTKAGLRLVDTTDHVEEDEVWRIVRYERRRGTSTG